MYQSYHEYTDTKQPSPPLLNKFFFRACLIHLNTMSYRTFAASGRTAEGVAGLSGGLPRQLAGREAEGFQRVTRTSRSDSFAAGS